MCVADAPIRVLLIRSWLHNIEPLRAAMRASGLDPRFIRVDIEPALNAALSRAGFDVIVLDPATPGLPRATVEVCMREHAVHVPLVVLETFESIGGQVRSALAARLS